MQKHPMVSVKEAAAALGCDERWVREKLNQGQLKGEKKTIGMKEKWFVYRGEVDAALAKRGPSYVSPEPIASHQYFGVDEDTVEAVDVQTGRQEESTDSVAAGSLEEIVRVIATQFAEKLEEEKRVKVELQKELEEKERQLRLLPDLQRRADEERQLAEQERKAAELRALEIEALNKQISALENEKRELQEKANEAIVLVDDLKVLKQKVEELQKPWWKRIFQGETGVE